MNQINLTTIALMLSVTVVGCGRGQQELEAPAGSGSKLAEVTLKKPVDKDGVLKAGVDYDTAEILFRSSEENASWQTKTTLPVAADGDNTDKALSFKPGTYAFNIKLINSKTKTVVATAFSDRTECQIPTATLVAGKKTEVALSLCREGVTDPVANPVGTESDVSFSPQIVGSTHGTTTTPATPALALTKIEGFFQPTAASVFFSLENTAKTVQTCVARITWIATLERKDGDGKSIVKKWDTTKALAEIAAGAAVDSSFVYERPAGNSDEAKEVSIDLYSKCDGEKDFRLLRSGSLAMQNSTTKS